MTAAAYPIARRLDGQASLLQAIEDTATEIGLEFCDVCGFGELKWVELLAAGEQDTRRFEGPLDLIHLQGRIRRAGEVWLADYMCAVSRGTDNGIQLLGGKLIAAGAEFVELTFIPLTEGETVAQVTNTVSTGDSRGTASTAGKAREPSSAGEPLAGRWAEALAESKRQERDAQKRGWDWDSDEEEVRPSRGDIVVHRQFGRCQVVRLDDDHISLRKPDGRVVQLGLAVLEFTAADREGDKAVYEVSVKRS